MSYASKIKQGVFPWGGRALVTVFPAPGFVSIVGSIAGGSTHAPSKEFAETHAQMLLEGTAKRNKKELQIALDMMGASLSFGAAAERLVFSAQVRTVHMDTLLALIAEILATPAFPEKELTILKMRTESDLAMAKQDPNTQAKIGISRLVYKKGHPNFQETTDESRASLKKISSKLLKVHHKNILNGNTLVISVAGDIQEKQVLKLIDAHFKALPHKNISSKKFKKASAGKAARTVTPIKNKASITYITAIASGITNTHPDYLPLALGIQVLGNAGGFTGRLMKTVREDEGLTYGVYSYFSSAAITSTIDGHIEVWATFAPALFKKGRTAIMREIKKIVTTGVSDEEVKKHRQLFDAKFSVGLSNSMAFARAAHGAITDGKKLSYLDEMPKKVLKLSANQVNRALKKYLRPALLSESAAGPVEKNAFKL